MSSRLSSIYVPVEGDAFHAVVDRIARGAREQVDLRRLERAELSPPHPWLKLPASVDDVPVFARLLSEEMGETALGLVAQPSEGVFGFWRFDAGRETREAWDEGVADASAALEAVIAHYDLPRFSDHKLRIGPAPPFRRFELFWRLLQ